MNIRLILAAFLFTLVPSVFLSQYAQAADGTWLGTGFDELWNNPADRVDGVIPDAADGTSVNTDTALFNTNPPQTTVTVNPNRNLKNINFDTEAGSYTIGGAGASAGNSLLLTSGGAISILSTPNPTNAVETFNAPLVLEGANGIYSFTNNSASGNGVGAGTLNFAGNLTGGAAGATVLTLSGSNTNANTINGIISDGSTGSDSVNKTGAGTWGVTGATYTGTTTVSSGVLQLSNSTNNYANIGGDIILNGGTLNFLFNNPSLGGVNNSLSLTTDSTIGSLGQQLNFGNGADTFNGNGHVLTVDNGASTSPFFLQGNAGTAASQVNLVRGAECASHVWCGIMSKRLPVASGTSTVKR